MDGFGLRVQGLGFRGSRGFGVQGPGVCKDSSSLEFTVKDL